MRKYYYFILILLISMFVSCHNAEVEEENPYAPISDALKENTSIILCDFNEKTKTYYFDYYDITDRTNPYKDKQLLVKPNFDKYKFIFPIAITDKYIWFQGAYEDYDRREEWDSPKFSLMLYSTELETQVMPIIEKEFEGYPGTAFYLVEDSLFIGCNNKVRLATYKDGEITLQTLHDFNNNEDSWNFYNKTIDAFVEYGDGQLLAIDDVIAPFYGFIIDIKDLNNPKYIKTIELPTYINNHYINAVSDKSHVYTLSSYGHRGGDGDLIFALKYEGNKFYVDYVYYGFKESNYLYSEEKKDPESYEGYFFPNISNINQLEDKILLLGMHGIIELKKNPKLPQLHERKLTVEEFNENEIERGNRFLPPETEDIKLHDFEGVITKITVVENTVYAVHVYYDKKPVMKTYGNYENKKVNKVELLVLEYDKANRSFKTVNKIELDKWISDFVIN